MVNHLLVNIVNSVLGVGKPTARGNQAHNCPFCHHAKPKLEINFSEGKKNPWHCWVCGKKGTRISTLFKQLKASPDKFTELYKLVAEEKEYQTVENEAERNDKEFKYVAAWGYNKNDKPKLFKEDLKYKNVKLKTRSYK